ncbi:MAG: hypothetical protein R2681_06075 [Pyrinomonadaceae bacterium]
MNRKIKPIKRRSRVRRERDPIPWKYCILTLVCGLIFVAGFFMAARLHFSSIDYGFKNSKLRKELDKLDNEKRRLVLEREMALSSISKTAEKIGFRKSTPNNLELVTMRKNIDREVVSDIPESDAKPIKAFIKEDETGSISSPEENEKKGLKKTVISESRSGKAGKKKEREEPKFDAGEISAAIIAKKR